MIFKYRYYLLTIVAILILILSRFILLDQSARFIWDESDDLLRMKSIFENRRITLVGPISGNNINIYGSLSYYMLMPFAVALNFDPLGPAIGTAFYSVILVVSLAYFFYKKLHWSFSVAVLFLTFVFPYLQSGRWAWNPHYIPFWQSLSMMVLLIPQLQKKWYVWVVVGLLQGLGIHNHWYAVFSMAGVFIMMAVYFRHQKEWKPLIGYCIGGFLAILPFIVFDLLRPPGLFISRLLYFSPVVSTGLETEGIDYISRLWQLPYQYFY